jgi:hypothetical protein
MKHKFKTGSFQTKAAIAFVVGILCCTFVHGITDVPYDGIQTGALFFILLTARSAQPSEMLKSIDESKSNK